MEFHKGLLEDISHLLMISNQTVSVAESATSGGLQLAFSQMPHASLVYKGGITAYSLMEKVNLLHVDREEGERCDCVSENIAETMVLSVRELFKTDWSVATTGYCTPVRNSGFNIYLYFSISFNEEILFTHKIELHPKTEALTAQLYYTEYILGCLKSQLQKLPLTAKSS
ncbi:damage-inducible protein CinA [Elizabethkingia anophelis]|uniref:CinA family protein n=1 Tax=Elizabethkingia anophelis TaxID=1117645 RepID=UPI000C6E8B88|nr:CinA family protein [Elizabethkingia anophelis]MDV3508372.1 damage-inducible protein CinA [Elizabethkingia anophelis]MDV3541208.1 damage-inducible protein CinA [Elizabethkingia anophelis]PKR31575.1 damage-inducible protein CinA [Elizabethkingia anophelis]PKR33817.1 damage-inducible protein CinA [Elizabethkingia anophelis]PRQ78309.1 damage-inducible protein CinA [Elizabethkingia anophelis]